MNARSLGYTLLALVVVVGLTVPTAAVSTADGTSAADTNGAAAAQETANDSKVNVTIGQQLSTVVDVSSDEVQTDFENTAFEVSVESASEEEQAEAIADRAELLRDRAEDIRDDHEAAAEAYREGEISRSEYAQRLATLNARATNVVESHEQLRKRAQNVSALELQAAGMNRSALRASVDNLSSVSGAGVAALLNQFTGEAEGEIELETADGLSVETRNEDGERSREFERPRDDDPNITVTQSAALDTGRAALSSPENSTWTLIESKVTQGEGYYEFAFALRGAPTRIGEAEVRVDGSSGEVFRLEEETETRDEEDEEDGADETDSELALVVSGGTPGPDETVTLKVLSNGNATGDVTVSLNDRPVGTTAADGTVTVTLPESSEAEITAQTGDSEGELEFEFEDDEGEDGEVFRNLNVGASLADDTATVSVGYNGSGVANATVYANDRTVGTTASDGTVTFGVDTNTTEELEVEVVKGVFEAELTYTVQNGVLTLTEEAHEGDGDKAEAEEEAEEEEAEEEAEEEEAEDEETEEEEAEDGETEEETEEADDEETEEEEAEDEETEEETEEAEDGETEEETEEAEDGETEEGETEEADDEEAEEEEAEAESTESTETPEETETPDEDASEDEG